jgi:ribose transport system permease protein
MPVEVSPTEATRADEQETSVEGATQRSRRQRWTDLLRLLSRSGFFWIFLVLLGLIVTFAATLPSGTFISTFNAQTIATDSSGLLLLAAGSTLVIISGGLDLSIGSVMTFSAVASVVAMDAISNGGTVNPTTAIVIGASVGVLGGMAWGLINGVLVAYAKLPPFVVTLGSFGAAFGVARLMTNGSNASGTPAELQQNIGLAEVFGIPVPFLIAAGGVIVLGLLLSRTRFGEHTYLIGSNEEAARRGGIRIGRHLLVLYVLCGAMAGLAGLLEVSRFGVASVSTGHTTELIAAIAAVVIGGASLTGGVGWMSGTVVGVFIPVVLTNGLLIGGIERFWQDVVVGIILVAAVGFDQWRRTQELRSP